MVAAARSENGEQTQQLGQVSLPSPIRSIVTGSLPDILLRQTLVAVLPDRR